MDVYAAIQKRRSVRNYKADEIPEDVLAKLLDSMRLAPSGGNSQPRKFIVVRDKATKERLAAACRFNPGRLSGQAFIAEAPVIIVACGSEQDAVVKYYKDGQLFIGRGRTVLEEMKKGPVEYETCLTADLAIALDHLTLAAVEEGLGTCWVGGFDEKLVKELLSIPDDVRVPFVMPVGYPVSWPGPRPRKPLEEVICYERYS
jgi:nitroreductase